MRNNWNSFNGRYENFHSKDVIKTPNLFLIATTYYAKNVPKDWKENAKKTS